MFKVARINSQLSELVFKVSVAILRLKLVLESVDRLLISVQSTHVHWSNAPKQSVVSRAMKDLVKGHDGEGWWIGKQQQQHVPSVQAAGSGPCQSNHSQVLILSNLSLKSSFLHSALSFGFLMPASCLTQQLLYAPRVSWPEIARWAKVNMSSPWQPARQMWIVYQ